LPLIAFHWHRPWMKKVRRTLRTMSLLLMTLPPSESHYKDKEESKTILMMM
jgi:hypothetical protein